jgi:hypothetical protein
LVRTRCRSCKSPIKITAFVKWDKNLWGIGASVLFETRYSVLIKLLCCCTLTG